MITVIKQEIIHVGDISRNIEIGVLSELWGAVHRSLMIDMESQHGHCCYVCFKLLYIYNCFIMILSNDNVSYYFVNKVSLKLINKTYMKRRISNFIKCC